MGERPWELVLAVLGEAAWDAASELAAMIADEQYPPIMRDDLTRSYAATTVLKLVTDSDYRRCIEHLLTPPDTGATSTLGDES